MSQSVHKCFIFIVILLGIVSCAGRLAAPPAGFEDFEFLATGKFSIRLDDTAHTANFRWRQLSERYDVEVWGPLGQGRTSLTGTGQEMVVSRGQEVLAVGSPEGVMYTHLGWSVPVAVLPHWLRGTPALSHSAMSPVPGGDAVLLRELGWQIEFSRYENSFPGRIVASQAGRRIVISVRTMHGAKDIQ